MKIKNNVNKNKFETEKFGLFEDFNKNIEQQGNGIYYHLTKEDKKVIMYDGVFTNAILNIDLLGNKQPEFSIAYKNFTSGIHEEYTGNFEEIYQQFKGNCSERYIQSDNDIKTLIKGYIHYLNNFDLLNFNKYYSINGYFLDNEGNFIDNNKYMDQYRKLTEVEIKEQLQVTVDLFNDFLNYNHEYFTYIAKYVLLSPFFYVFKQLGLQDLNRITIAYGKGKAGKTTNIEKLLSLYYGNNNKSNMYSIAGTEPALKNELNQFDTLPLISDEAYGLIKDNKVQELLKKLRFNTFTKSTSNNDKQGQNKQYKGYNTLFLTTNKSSNIFEGLSRACLLYMFNESIDSKNKQEYHSKFGNVDLSIIGYVFSRELSGYIEDGKIKDYDNELKNNLLINEIINDIESKYNVKFNDLFMNCNALDIDKEDIAIYDYIKVCVENIASIFYNDKNHSKTEEGLKQFIKTNPKMNIFKQAPNLNYWFISKKNLDKLLFVNAKNNVVNVHEYCQEVELNYITDGYNYNKKSLLDINKPSIIKLFKDNNDTEQRCILNKNVRKSYLINFEGLKTIFNCNSIEYEDIQENYDVERITQDI